MISPFLGAFDSTGIPQTTEGAIAARFGSPIDPTRQRSCCALYGANISHHTDIRVAFSGLLANEEELRRAYPGAPPGAAGMVEHLFRTQQEWMHLIWGEYVAAIYDGRDRSLTLIRDRIGFYPLFTTRLGSTIYFSTSINSLLAIPEITPKPSLETLARFLGTHYRHVEGGRRSTAFADIENVSGGTFIRITENGWKENSYWDARNIPERSPYSDEGEAADAVRAILSDAVARRTRGVMDHSGFALSSGMDSSSILALAVSGGTSRPPIFTTSFAGWKDDEAADAKETAGNFGDWRPIVIGTIPDFLDAAEMLQSEHDEPVVTVTWLWDFLMQRDVAQSGCRTFFGGLGGDELFAGEFEHFFFHFADLDQSGENEVLEYEIQEWIRLHDHPVHRKSKDAVHKIWKRMRDSDGRVKTDPDRHGRYLSALSPEMRAASGPAPLLENPWRSYLRNRLWQDLRGETTLPCLRAATHNAAAHHLEIRFPFLDHRVVEIAMPLPGEWSTRPLYDREFLRRIVSEHRVGLLDHSMFLWQFAAVEAWWKRWLA